MQWKNRVYRLTGKIVIITIVIFLPAGNVLGAEKESLPHLIQTTTLESDYRALAELKLAVTPLLAEENVQKAFENILCSCVRIQTRGHYGSGSIYKMLENEIIIVTNRHVLMDWDEEGSVTFFNGAAAFGELLGVSEMADVGFIRIPTEAFPIEELLIFRNVRVVPDPEKGIRKGLMEGCGFFCVDMSDGFSNPVVRQGEILSPLLYLEDFGMEMLYGRGEAVPGMSGSGVFDGRGSYLGMMTGATLQDEVAAVPGKVVEEEYEKIRTEYEKNR